MLSVLFKEAVEVVLCSWFFKLFFQGFKDSFAHELVVSGERDCDFKIVRL